MFHLEYTSVQGENIIPFSDRNWCAGKQIGSLKSYLPCKSADNLQSISCPFNPFMSSGLFYLNSLDLSISSRRSLWLVFNITEFYINSNI